MGATLVRNVSENDDWTITTDMRRAELYNYRCVLPTSMVPGRTNSKRWKFASHTDGGCHRVLLSKVTQEGRPET